VEPKPLEQISGRRLMLTRLDPEVNGAGKARFAVHGNGDIQFDLGVADGVDHVAFAHFLVRFDDSQPHTLDEIGQRRSQKLFAGSGRHRGLLSITVEVRMVRAGFAAFKVRWVGRDDRNGETGGGRRPPENAPHDSILSTLRPKVQAPRNLRFPIPPLPAQLNRSCGIDRTGAALSAAPIRDL